MVKIFTRSTYPIPPGLSKGAPESINKLSFDSPQCLSVRGLMRGRGSCVLFCLLFSLSVTAQLKLPAIISDNMVLQSGMKVPVWGRALPGEKIEVSFRNKTFTTTVNADSNWLVKLDSYQPGGPYEMLVKSNSSQQHIQNIWIGEVWLASGQSNMELGIQRDKNSEAAIAHATDSLIHFFYVPMAHSMARQWDIGAPANPMDGKWIVCSPAAMAGKWAWKGFSAVGYYFAQQIRKKTGSAVGMIGSYKGGTPAQAWTSLEGLQQDTAFKRHIEKRQAIIEEYKAKEKTPGKEAAYQEALKKWKEDPSKPQPQPPINEEGGFNGPSNLFHAMIAPLIPYAIKGVIWYQGESNGDRLPDAVEYAKLFPQMIRDWRQQWKQGEFPFLFVQLPNFKDPAQTPSEGIWPWVREAQLKTLAVPRTGMAVAIDVGDPKDIHPTDKAPVGYRLSLAADKVAYGDRKIEYSGPLYESMKVKGNEVHIRFSHTGSGLEVHGLPGSSVTPVPLSGFAIAGEDRQFVWAKARIEGNTVIVAAEAVGKPVAVRYGWADNPPANLFNKEGLPASPFRTDNWPAK